MYDYQHMKYSNARIYLENSTTGFKISINQKIKEENNYDHYL